MITHNIIYVQLSEWTLDIHSHRNSMQSQFRDWIGLCSVLRPLQHSIGYMGDGFYRSKDPTDSIKVLKEATKENKNNTKNIIHTEIRNSTR